MEQEHGREKWQIRKSSQMGYHLNRETKHLKVRALEGKGIIMISIIIYCIHPLIRCSDNTKSCKDIIAEKLGMGHIPVIPILKRLNQKD
jgi:hypothetical protein